MTNFAPSPASILRTAALAALLLGTTSYATLARPTVEKAWHISGAENDAGEGSFHISGAENDAGEGSTLRAA